MNTDIMAMDTSVPDASDIVLPDVSDLSLDASVKKTADIFHVSKRASWDKSVEARCDFTYKLRLTHRAGLAFISPWHKSVYGRTLTDIKSDDEMVPFFVEHLTPIIRDVVGVSVVGASSWAVVTTPMRRHLERNFASRIAEGVAAELRLPFYFDCAHCASRHRVNAEFTAHNIPSEPNIIVIDDFVTTGSTLRSMRNLLDSQGKTSLLFAGINNKI